MPILEFPDPHSANAEGIVAAGGDLLPDTLLTAYRAGIFPWPVPGLPLLWFCPAERAVLQFDDLHVSRSLARARRSTMLRFTVDEDFPNVIRSCAKTPRPGQEGTWITPQVITAYVRLHQLGITHSVEAWNGSRLVGGVYGVAVDGAFAAESMFYYEANASKLALLHLVEHLHARGLDWIDVQVMTPHIKGIGAKLISRDQFLTKLGLTRRRGRQLFGPRTPEPLNP